VELLFVLCVCEGGGKQGGGIRTWSLASFWEEHGLKAS